MTMRNMLSPAKARDHRDLSPFSSPYSNLLSSPVNARRSSAEERRRPAAKFSLKISPGSHREIEMASDEEDQEEEDQEEHEEEEEEEQNDEVDDDAGELSPLLPIFSAEHLGSSQYH